MCQIGNIFIRFLRVFLVLYSPNLVGIAVVILENMKISRICGAHTKLLVWSKFVITKSVISKSIYID
jgi:hypothetical protein